MRDGVNVWRPNLRRAAFALGVRVGLEKRDASAPNRSSADARAAPPARNPSVDGEQAARAATSARDERRAHEPARGQRLEMENWIRLLLRGAGGRLMEQTRKLFTGAG